MQIIVSCGWKANRNCAIEKLIVHSEKAQEGDACSHMQEKAGMLLKINGAENKLHHLSRDLTGYK